MHQAPTVHWPVPRLRTHAFVVLVLWLTGLGTIALWCLQVGEVSAVHGLGLAALLLSAVVALAAWAASGPGALDWNGNGWTWTPDGEAAQRGALTVAIDLQGVVLLRFDAMPLGVRWLWVRQAGDLAHWRAFRRAVFSAPGSGASGETAFTGAAATGPASR